MANVNWTKGLARLNAWHAGPRFGGLTKPFQEITNDPPIVAVNQFPISDLSPCKMVADDLFEQANGRELGWYDPKAWAPQFP